MWPSQPQESRVDVSLIKTGTTLVARPLGRWLDARTSADLQRVVAAELERGERHVVLDLAEVVNVDSAALGTLVRLLRLVPAGGRLVLCGCRPSVQKLLEKARFDRLLVSYPGVAEAVASFEGA
jgi:anti-anti-sigma factor